MCVQAFVRVITGQWSLTTIGGMTLSRARRGIEEEVDTLPFLLSCNCCPWLSFSLRPCFLSPEATFLLLSFCFLTGLKEEEGKERRGGGGREDNLVRWCSEPSQPQRIISGLKTNFCLFLSYSVQKSQNRFSKNYFLLLQFFVRIFHTKMTAPHIL